MRWHARLPKYSIAKKEPLMKKNLLLLTTLSFIGMTLLLTTSSFAEGPTSVLNFKMEQDIYQIYICEGKVVGGKITGKTKWIITGGYFDNRYLHCTGKKETIKNINNCDNWYTFSFRISDQGPLLISAINRCGKATTDLNRKSSWKN
jgi:hypothetical protein